MRGLKKIQEREFALLFDGIRYSLFASQRAFKSLERDIRAVEEVVPRDLGIEKTFDILMYCWQILDHTYRSHEIFGQLAPFRLKDNRTRTFVRCGENVSAFRSIYHHLRRSISEIPEKAPPIIGSLSWMDSRNNQRCLTLSLSSGASEFTIPTLVVDTWTGEFAKDYMFHVGNKGISILDVAKACAGATEAIEQFLEDRGVFDKHDVKPVIFSTEFPRLLGM